MVHAGLSVITLEYIIKDISNDYTAKKRDNSTIYVLEGEDEKTFINFNEWIKNYNTYIKTAHTDALKDKGDIASKEIEQFYDDEAKMFLPDRFIKGECPKCGAKDQYGDSCEECRGGQRDPAAEHGADSEQECVRAVPNQIPRRIPHS